MKRVFSVLLFVFLTMSVVAQQRMKFLGQPLGCSFSTFKQKMVAKGFKYKGEVETNIHYFDGVFGGDDVNLGVFVTPKSKIVYEVGVSFQNVMYDGYDSTKEKYLLNKKEQLVESFTKKYGYPISKDDYSWWYFDYGAISINISKDTIRSGSHQLIIFYEDYAGSDKCDLEKESDY